MNKIQYREAELSSCQIELQQPRQKEMPPHQQPAQQKGQELFSVSLSNNASHYTPDSSLIG